MLAPTGLTLGELDRHAGRLEPATDRADDVLVLRRLQDVVVLEPRRVRAQVAIALGVGLLVGVVEEVELDLTGDHRQEAQRGGGLLLAAQHRARRHLDQFAGVDVEQVAHDHRRRARPTAILRTVAQSARASMSP